eukprot:364757-Chlamydomonas_euryale.AAC.7
MSTQSNVRTHGSYLSGRLAARMSLRRGCPACGQHTMPCQKRCVSQQETSHLDVTPGRHTLTSRLARHTWNVTHVTPHATA